MKRKPESTKRKLTPGWKLIAAERRRQMNKEGWTSEHDDTHARGELGEAAQCYITQARGRAWLTLCKYIIDDVPDEWPWGEEWWNPQSPIRDLVKAGALIAAEIDRLQRLKLSKGSHASPKK